MSWIHCNVCACLPSSSKDNKNCFVMTSCGHICCYSCSDKKGKDICAMCVKKCSKVVLTDPLPPQVAPWVNDPLPSLRKLKEAFKFQTMQNDCLMELQLRKYKEYYEELLKRKQFLESRKSRLLLEISKKQTQVHSSVTGRDTTIPSSAVAVTPRVNVATSCAVPNREITLQTPATLRLNQQHTHC